MDKKRTQRILGILVIIALVIILFPLISGKNDLTNQFQSSIKSSPPADNEPQSEHQPLLADEAFLAQVPETPSEPILNNDTSSPDIPPAPSTINSLSSENDVNNEMAPAVLTEDDTFPVPRKAVKIPEPIVNAQEVKLMDDERIKQNENPIVVIKSTASASKTVMRETPAIKAIKKVAVKKQSKSDTKFSHASWVIQLGSFKNKTNARQLTDTLRAAGYKAFVQEVKSSGGRAQTRVYIGPEYRQASAISLSAKIRKELMLQGIVVPYKPLAL